MVVEKVIEKNIPTADDFYNTTIPNEAMEDFIKKGPPNLKKPGYENIVHYKDAYEYLYVTCGLTQTGCKRGQEGTLCIN